MLIQPRTWLAAAFLSFGLLSATSGLAALESRLGGLAVYDTDLDITWATNANINGPMTWAAANSWVAGLTIDGIHGWRLPITTNPDCNTYNCAGSEMAHLFYSELGGVANVSIATTHNSNYDLFSNVQVTGSGFYWSGTDMPGFPDAAVAFVPLTNIDQYYQKTYSSFFALAVHPGDVAAIPEPETYAMMLVGVGLISWQFRRKARRSSANRLH